MARFVAITEKPGLTEDQFREALNRTGKWRFGKRSWVVKAYCALGKGKLVIECETPEQSQFEQWLESHGWKAREVHQVNFIHEGGLIWPIRS